MFQNINEDINTNSQEKEESKFNLFSNILEKKNIIIYIISFMISFISLGGEFSIFSISLLGACIASSIPILGVLVVSLIAHLIQFGIGGACEYFLTAMLMIVTLFIFKPRYNEEERNEKIKIGRNVLLSVIIIQVIKILMVQFTMYDVLSAITIAIIAFVFYKIFVNSLVAIQDFYREKAFTIEELIGASLLLAIAIGALGDINIFGINIRNILSILIVMILGWKNGILVGTTAGVTIGVTLGVITGTEPIMIAAYAISGMVAGIFSRFGKIGVIVGFGLGNIILAYVSNGYTVELIHFKEILIASVGLLIVPNTLHIDLEEFIPNRKFLPVIPNRALNRSKEVVENLNNVSEAIQEMATTYKKVEPTSFEENTQKNTNKQIFMIELVNNLESYKDNPLYDEIAEVDGEISKLIFETLLEKQEMTNEDLITIFSKCNSYILGLEDSITQIVRVINISYKVSKSDFVWRKRVEENNKNVEKQLKGVSKAIQNMAKGIEKEIENEEKYEKERIEILELCKQKEIDIEEIALRKENRFIIDMYTKENLETVKIETIEKIATKILKEKIVLNDENSIGRRLTFLSADKYELAIGTSDTTKSKSELSGDSILNIRLKDGKYLVALSDGMGTGKEARKSSVQALRLLENLLASGFDKNTSLDLINTALINQNNEIFATLDIAIIDLYLGTIEFIKSGACPTYIKNKKSVQVIKSNSLPTGIMNEIDIQTFDKDINSGDIMLMCSDGILDSNVEYKNKELWIKYMLEDLETTNTRKIADLILNESIDNNFGLIKDDMTVIVCKFKKV